MSSQLAGGRVGHRLSADELLTGCRILVGFEGADVDFCSFREGHGDVTGNMTNDNTNTLVYDAENRATSATDQSYAAAYVYDGNGMRVEKCVPNSNCTKPPPSTVYIFSSSKVIAEY